MFSAHDSSGHVGLWEVGATGGGATEFYSSTYAGDSVGPLKLASIGGKLLFDDYDSSGELGVWASDGTAAGTIELTSGPESTRNQYTGPFFAFEGKALFYGDDAAGNDGLWITDGTVAGTQEICSTVNLPGGFTVVGNEVYFSGRDSTGNFGLWVTDGTAAGTKEVETGQQGNSSLSPNNLTPFGSRLAFTGTDSLGGVSVWVTNGVTTEVVEPGEQINQTLNPSLLEVIGDELLFDGTDTNGDNAEWVSDGTFSGTKELSLDGVSNGNQLLAVSHTADDFYDLGRSDLAFQSAAGEIAAWQIDGHAISGGGSIGTPGPAWTLVATGDVTGQGYSDMIFSNSSDGQIAVWQMFGTTIAGAYFLGRRAAAGKSWGPAISTATGPRSLFRDDQRRTRDLGPQRRRHHRRRAHRQSGRRLGRSSAQAISTATARPTSCSRTPGEPTRSGTFRTTRSHRRRQLWERQAVRAGCSRELAISTATERATSCSRTPTPGNMRSGTSPTTTLSSAAATIGDPGPDWAFKAIGNYWGDDKSDILFENVVTGQYVAWEMNNASITTAAADRRPRRALTASRARRRPRSRSCRRCCSSRTPTTRS